MQDSLPARSSSHAALRATERRSRSDSRKPDTLRSLFVYGPRCFITPSTRYLCSRREARGNAQNVKGQTVTGASQVCSSPARSADDIDTNPSKSPIKGTRDREMKSWVVPSGKGRTGHCASLSKYKVQVVKVDPDCQCARVRFVDKTGSLAKEKAGQAAGRTIKANNTVRSHNQRPDLQTHKVDPPEPSNIFLITFPCYF
jgi:hypothetical protein